MRNFDIRTMQVGPFHELLYWPPPVVAIAVISFLLLETGDKLLQESGDSFILEN